MNPEADAFHKIRCFFTGRAVDHPVIPLDSFDCPTTFYEEKALQDWWIVAPHIHPVTGRKLTTMKIVHASAVDQLRESYCIESNFFMNSRSERKLSIEEAIQNNVQRLERKRESEGDVRSFTKV